MVCNILAGIFFLYAAVQFIRLEEKTAPPATQRPLFGKAARVGSGSGN